MTHHNSHNEWHTFPFHPNCRAILLQMPPSMRPSLVPPTLWIRTSRRRCIFRRTGWHPIITPLRWHHRNRCIIIGGRRTRWRHPITQNQWLSANRFNGHTSTPTHRIPGRAISLPLPLPWGHNRDSRINLGSRIPHLYDRPAPFHVPRLENTSPPIL